MHLFILDYLACALRYIYLQCTPENSDLILPSFLASISQLRLKFSFCAALYCVYSSFASFFIIFTFSLCSPIKLLVLGVSLAKCSSLVHCALSYLLVLHGSIAVPPTHLHSAPSGVVRLYQVAAHAPFIVSFSSFDFGVVDCTVLATSRCNNGLHGLIHNH